MNESFSSEDIESVSFEEDEDHPHPNITFIHENTPTISNNLVTQFYKNEMKNEKEK